MQEFEALRDADKNDRSFIRILNSFFGVFGVSAILDQFGDMRFFRPPT